MAVAKRQGRSEDQSEDFRQNKQHSWLSPICIGEAQVEEVVCSVFSYIWREVACTLFDDNSAIWISFIDFHFVHHSPLILF